MLSKTKNSVFPVTVLMAVYNGEKYLAEAIESILNQTYSDFEFLIINDGSTDSSESIILSYKSKDKRIRYIYSEHKGSYQALNLGLKEAEYDWIALQDDDDISLPNRLERQIETIKANPRIRILSTYGYYIEPKSKKIVGAIEIGPVTEQECFRLINENKHIFFLNSKLIHKDTVLKAGGFRFAPLTDLDLHNRIGDLNELMLSLPEHLYLVRRREGSITTSANIFDYQRRMRWIKRSMIERRSGREEPTYDEFSSSERTQPVCTRINLYRKDLGVFLYRRFGMNLISGSYIKGILCGIASLVIFPRYFFKKIVLQQKTLLKKKAQSFIPFGKE